MDCGPSGPRGLRAVGWRAQVNILWNTAAFDGSLRHPAVWPLVQRLMGGDASPGR